MNTKPKRPRKPAEPIKVAGNTKTGNRDGKSLSGDINERRGSFERVGDIVAFVDDRNGRWRLVGKP